MPVATNLDPWHDNQSTLVILLGYVAAGKVRQSKGCLVGASGARD
jgi:hypothetical protein